MSPSKPPKPSKLPKPWDAFLTELDGLMRGRIELHCIGGFAVVVGYGSPRATKDLDYRTVIPYNRINELQELAGPASALAKKHKVHVQRPGVEDMPEDYQERLTDYFSDNFRNIRLRIPDAYDLCLSKLSRNAERDREDVRHLARTQKLTAAILRSRYEEELRPRLIGPVERHDHTLRFWIEAYFCEV